MAFQIGGHDRGGPSVRTVDRDRQRTPAGGGGRAPGFFERGQEIVGQERIVPSGTGVPVRGRECRHPLGDPRDERLAAHPAVS